MTNRYTYILPLCVILLALTSSFRDNNACKNIGSNIGFVKTQTEKAIKTDDLNIAKYHAYKALNAIEKSKKQFKECGCYTAELSLYKGLEHLKNATKETSINNAKSQLKKALKNTEGSLHALDEYNTTAFPTNILAMNTKSSNKEYGINSTKILHSKIDKTLIKFELSLNNVVRTLECEKAQKYAQTVFDNCEKKLLNEDLSEAKKYYNLRTKEIASKALRKLNNCPN